MKAPPFHWTAALLVVFWLAVGSFVAPASGEPPAAQPALWEVKDAAHLLRRAGFSGTPEQIARLHALGRDGAVEYLITGALPAGKPAEAAVFPPARLIPIFLAPDEAADSKIKGKERNKQMDSLRSQWVFRMIRTDRPLEEKMVLFWHGLFTSGIDEVKVPRQLLTQQLTFRQHALGNYRALTLAMLHDPAMLKYLDNTMNTKHKPNENLARELCELFTMGEGKGYTEKDIEEVARALTGAGVDGKAKTDGEYEFRAGQHDAGPKTIFGKTGNYKPDDVVDLIFERPEPAVFLAGKLWAFFVYPEPSDADLAPIAASLRDNKYEVAPALRAIFTSNAFYSDRAKFACIKSPAELVVGTIRMLAMPNDLPAQKHAAASAITEMGQELFQPPNVRGWPGGDTWITAATIFERYNVASDLVDGCLMAGKRQHPKKGGPPARQFTGRMSGFLNPVPTGGLFPGVPEGVTPAQLVAAAVDRFMQRPIAPEKVKVLVDGMGTSPIKFGEEGSDKRIRQMLALLLSTPEYQVE